MHRHIEHQFDADVRAVTTSPAPATQLFMSPIAGNSASQHKRPQSASSAARPSPIQLSSPIRSSAATISTLLSQARSHLGDDSHLSGHQGSSSRQAAAAAMPTHPGAVYTRGGSDRSGSGAASTNGAGGVFSERVRQSSDLTERRSSSMPTDQHSLASWEPELALVVRGPAGHTELEVPGSPFPSLEADAACIAELGAVQDALVHQAQSMLFAHARVTAEMTRTLPSSQSSAPRSQSSSSHRGDPGSGVQLDVAATAALAAAGVLETQGRAAFQGASRLEHLRSRLSGALHSHAASASAAMRTAAEAQSRLEAVRAELNSAWSAKWRERESGTSAQLAMLRRRVAEYEAERVLSGHYQRGQGPQQLQGQHQQEQGGQSNAQQQHQQWGAEDAAAAGPGSFLLQHPFPFSGASSHSTAPRSGDLQAALFSALADRDTALAARFAAEGEADALARRSVELQAQVTRMQGEMAEAQGRHVAAVTELLQTRGIGLGGSGVGMGPVATPFSQQQQLQQQLLLQQHGLDDAASFSSVHPSAAPMAATAPPEASTARSSSTAPGAFASRPALSSANNTPRTDPIAQSIAEAQLTALREALAHAQSSATATSTELFSLRKQVSELASTLAERTSQRDLAKAQASASALEVTALLTRHQQRSVADGASVQRAAAAAASAGVTSAALSEREERIAALSAELSNLRRTLGASEAALVTARADILSATEAAGREAEEARAQGAAALAEARGAARREATAAQASITTLKADLASLKFDLKRSAKAAETAAAEASAAVDAARVQATQAARAEGEEAMRFLVQRLAGEHEAEVRSASRAARDAAECRGVEALRSAQLEADERADALCAAHAEALSQCEAMARGAEAEAWKGRMEALRQQCDAASAAANTRVTEAQAVVHREVARRRAFAARIAEIQGNIRVHVRVRPSNLVLEAERRQLQQETARSSGGRRRSVDSLSWGLDDEEEEGGAGSVSTGVAYPAVFGTSAAAAAGGGEEGAAASSRRSGGGPSGTLPRGGGASKLTNGGGSGCSIECLGEGQLLLRSEAYGFTGAGAAAVRQSPGGPGAPGGGAVFEFEEVHGPQTSQSTVFDSVRPMLDRALQGVPVTIFAYGQTGSGKTHSMEGAPGNAGIALRALRHLFQCSAAMSGPSGAPGLAISISIMEIYVETVRDLLAGVTLARKGEPSVSSSSTAAAPRSPFSTAAPRRGGTSGAPPPSSAAAFGATLLKESGRIGVGSDGEVWSRGLRGSGGSLLFSNGGGGAGEELAVRDTSAGVVEVVGLTRIPVHSLEEALLVVRAGTAARSGGAHALNDRSSRSHMLIRLWISTSAPAPGSPPSPSEHSSFRPAPQPQPLSTINLVDLAGSERVSRSGAEGERLREAASINSSLSTLGSVIAGLKRRAAHIPFRDSKLTFILRDSLALGAGSRVLLLACVAPDTADANESACTLAFAARCRDTALKSTGGATG